MGLPQFVILWLTYTWSSLRTKALRTAENPPRLWKRFVDDTFVIQHIVHNEDFLQHINNIDSAIQLTVEDTRPDGSVPFLDTLVTPEHNGRLTTSV